MSTKTIGVVGRGSGWQKVGIELGSYVCNPNSSQPGMFQAFADTARYAGLLLAPAEGFGLRPRVCFALRAKKTNYHAFLANFRQFGFPVVTSVTLKRIQKLKEKNTKVNRKNKKI